MSETVARGKRINEIETVDYSPEKAGVGGSTPSLATIIPNNLAALSRNFPTHDPTHDSEIRPAISH
jgi:hypothetical protein